MSCASSKAVAKERQIKSKKSCCPLPSHTCFCCYFSVTLLSFADEERQTVALKGKITKDGLGDLIKSEKLPPTIEFNDQNSQKIFSSGIEKQLLLIANEKDLKADAELFKSYRKVGSRPGVFGCCCFFTG